MKKIILALTLAAGVLPVVGYAACTAPQSMTPWQIASQGDSDEIWANWAFYEWNESTQQWVLAEQGWDTFAEYEDLQVEDEVIPPTVFRSQRPIDPRPPRGPIRIMSDQTMPDMGIMSCGTKDMPRMIVQGVRPASSGFNGMMVYRGSGIVTRTNGGAFNRRIKNGIKDDQTITCQNSDDYARRERALARLQGILPRGVYLFRYGNGDRQLWAITQPMFSDKGLIPATPCHRAP